MSNILKVTSQVPGFENNSNVRTAQQENISSSNIKNPVDPSRVVRADEKNDANQNPGLELRYDSNFGNFVQMLKDIPQLNQILTQLFHSQMGNVVESGISSGTAEQITQFFQFMQMNSEQLMQFIKEQSKGNVRLQGPFFELLRKALNTSDSVEARTAILNFVKQYNDMTSGSHLLENIKYQLSNIRQYMFREPAEQLKELTSQIKNLQNGDVKENTEILKEKILPFLGEYISRTHDRGTLRDLINLVSYNTARYENGSMDRLLQSFKELMNYPAFSRLFPGMDAEALRSILSKVDFERAAGKTEWSDTFLNILEMGLKGEGGTETKQVFQNLLHSMLLNESVYMPLIHLMLPVCLNGSMLFSEIWIDPDAEGGGKAGEARTVKLLIKFDLKEVGFFDLILYCHNDVLDMMLTYPENLQPYEKDIREKLTAIVNKCGLQLSYFSLEKSKGSIPISAVFPKIFERKNSVDVKI